MAYGFVADAEKMQELHNDLVNTANEITAFIDDIYSKVNDLNSVWTGGSYDSFKSRCEMYRTSLEQLPDILNAFAVDMGTLSSNTNTMVVSIKALLDCSSMYVRDADVGIRTVKDTSRATDANGAFIPDTGTNDVKISIPTDTKVGTEFWACAEVGDPLYIETTNIQKTVDAEVAKLEAYKKDNAAAINKLPAAQKEALLNYINSEINQRKAVSKQITEATTGAWLGNDGAIFNATSVGLTGNHYVGGEQKAVDNAVACAKNINNNLKKMSDMSDIEAYVLDCDLSSIGG